MSSPPLLSQWLCMFSVMCFNHSPLPPKCEVERNVELTILANSAAWMNHILNDQLLQSLSLLTLQTLRVTHRIWRELGTDYIVHIIGCVESIGLLSNELDVSMRKTPFLKFNDVHECSTFSQDIVDIQIFHKFNQILFKNFGDNIRSVLGLLSRKKWFSDFWPLGVAGESNESLVYGELEQWPLHLGNVGDSSEDSQQMILEGWPAALSEEQHLCYC